MTQSNIRETTDSVRVVETVRDTVVQIEADSSLLRALIECDSLGQAHLKQLIDYRTGKRILLPTIALDNNILTVTVKADSMAIYMQLKERYKEAIRTETITIKQTVEVNVITWWQTLWIRLGQILTTLMIMVGGLKIYKLIKHP